MLQGFAGHLISETYLESLLGSPLDDAAGLARRRLTGWRSLSGGLGPASSLRAMLDGGAKPLAAALGFDPATAVAYGQRTVAVTLCGISGPVALIVTSWGERLDPLWRDAVSEARAPSRDVLLALQWNTSAPR